MSRSSASPSWPPSDECFHPYSLNLTPVPASHSDHRSPLAKPVCAALFALHPLHVESVAWVAERKDVLSGFFWFLTLLFYAGYVKHRTVKSYFLTLFSFVLVFDKPMLVTLPVTMLLLDYWPFHRFLRDQAEPGGLRVLVFCPW